MSDFCKHNQSEPLVSVVIPAHNAEKTIRETLDSVFSQTYTNLQIIVVNDASTDSTRNIINEYDDPRLVIIDLPQNVHVATARNAALEHVVGDYVAFLDSDDVWVSTKLEQQVAFLEQNSTYGACFTWGEIIDRNSQKWTLDDPEINTLHILFHEGNHSHKEWFFKFLEGGNCLLNSSALLRADLVRQMGMQNCSLLQLQDFEYWMRALSFQNIYILEQELTKYRRIKDNQALSSPTPQNNTRFDNESTIVLSHYFDYISDDLFTTLFRSVFQNPDASTKEELACEKLFLLKRAYCGPGPFLIKVQELLSNTACAKTLMEKYRYMPKDYYNINACFRYFVDIQKEGDCTLLRAKINTLNAELVSLSAQLVSLRAEINALQAQNTEMLHSRSWQITAPLRKATTALRSNRYTHLILKGIKSLKNNGFRATWIKAKNKLYYSRKCSAAAKRELYTAAELLAQREKKFPRDIKISILVPLYNTPERFLREMIQSVLDQTYANWELCLADGSDNQHGDVGRICMEYTKKDLRIRYKKLEKNLGISGNTNACIEMSTGDYIALFDHDDILHPAALHDVMTEICEKNADFVYTDEATFESPNIKKVITIHHKPDYALDNLRANNYICHMSVFSKELLQKAGGGFRAEYDGSQDHDLILRLTAEAEHIVHVPKVLYYWRSHPQSVAQDISAKKYAITAGQNAVRDSIARTGYQAIVESSRAFPTLYRIKYTLTAHPKVSIIIPSKDHVEDLKRCVDSIFAKTTYDNYEIVLVDNGSQESKTQAYYQELKHNPHVILCSLNIPFNFSKLCNFAVEKSSGQYFIFLNNDTEVITPEWIEEMLMYVQREDVAAAGAMLYYPDNTIQHAGIILGMGSDQVAGHPFYRCDKMNQGYMGRLCYAQNMSAVTAACMMVKASVFQDVGGFDETFAVAYNDVDLCMRIRKAGHLIVWTPYAELYHYESKSRGHEDTGEKMQRFQNEVNLFRTRWKDELQKGDPYYNPNFRLDRSDFCLK